MKRTSLSVTVLAITAWLGLAANSTAAPAPGEKAPDFTLKTVDDKPLRLAEVSAKGNVVLVVLRGWPGYQCPLCTAQVSEFVAAASRLAEAKGHVLMVYPGPAKDLQAHAREFLSSTSWPKDFQFVIDPDYEMINAYGLRWNAPRETAYPSTFVLDRKGIVRFAKVSRSHGDRAKPADVLSALNRLPDN